MAHSKRVRSAFASAVVIALSLGGAALGTPGSYVNRTAHVERATLAEDVRVNADGIRLRAKHPVDVSVVTMTLAPGGTTGWHRHPGVVLIAVAEGTGTHYSADCSSRTYSAGDVFVESGAEPAAVVRNETDGPFVITVTFMVPKGADLRIDEENPGCPGID